MRSVREENHFFLHFGAFVPVRPLSANQIAENSYLSPQVSYSSQRPLVGKVFGHWVLCFLNELNRTSRSGERSYWNFDIWCWNFSKIARPYFLEGKSKSQLHVQSSDRARVWCVVISIENKSFEIFFRTSFRCGLKLTNERSDWLTQIALKMIYKISPTKQATMLVEVSLEASNLAELENVQVELLWRLRVEKITFFRFWRFRSGPPTLSQSEAREFISQPPSELQLSTTPRWKGLSTLSTLLFKWTKSDQ